MGDDTQRYAAELIPSDYASWRYCIEVKCGLALKPDFLQARIAVLSDAGQEETKRFARLYGDAHLNQILAWFRQAAAES
ncbi:MAG: hypothetical protein N838_09115 [Thiohalocapsa sp. PB-PSB1]|jgi:hypothetical protein|nr:MAG: hypothetical protein N838_07540 [Thiohalocapsa sp. PB-PSB1]QQO53493.1 MAG: hypothetical protein N838_09115 [Thiohalocapsa sp. PB-PSB1]HCS90189.1 hypothetical protein [Chromatiaceae bacterium]